MLEDRRVILRRSHLLAITFVTLIAVPSLSLAYTQTTSTLDGTQAELPASRAGAWAVREDESESLTTQQITARAQEGLALVRDWSLRFGREIYQATQEVTCHRAHRDLFDPANGDKARRGPYRASVVSIDWTRAHADIVRTVSTSMGWTREAVEAIVRAAESLAGNHTHDDNLRVDYVDVHRLYDIDEMVPAEESGGSEISGPGGRDHEEYAYSSLDAGAGNESATGGVEGDQGPSGEQVAAGGHEEPPVASESRRAARSTELLGTPAPLVMQPAGTPMPEDAANGERPTPIRFLKLERHQNFGDVPISTETSAVHVPVHIYAGEPSVMNAIAWSEELTRVFKNNFVHNPKLTNQYFASPLGFMRLFPAQKWQIKRTAPDLYDARMRPWYVAGASSRKDVVVLVDSSGSMTGSRRDIAKGVVFEILDTLTDNDHFLVLKFNDIVQQVGVPACAKMRLERQRQARIPLKNTLFQRDLGSSQVSPAAGADSAGASDSERGNNGTDIDSLYLLPANGRNVRYVKTNFTLATSGIANFSHALVTAFEVLRKYQDNEQRNLGSQCNQAIMLITDGSPSDFEDIFNRYNYPNAPVRVFTYLIGRETSGDGPAHTKMMACHNRGYYTHVINLAEVRETVQQYIPVMARPLVLNRTHPTTWTQAYGELTYQILTDWIWESRRRERARNILSSAASASAKSPATGGGGGQYRPDIRVASSSSSLVDDLAGGQVGGGGGGGGDQSELPDLSGAPSAGDLDEQELDALDLFGYASNPDCFWETRRNDLMTTVVQPVYDSRNKSRVVEKFLSKNVWTKKESVVRTANLLGVAAADMRINDIIALAPSHKLGPNGYAIMLTNNGLVMHHPELRSILEPLGPASGAADLTTTSASDGSGARLARILKPFFSSLDLVQVEHILQADEQSQRQKQSSGSEEKSFLALREESVQGKTGWRELATKRTLDCQRRVQSRRQSFYYKPLDVFPFSLIVAIPQPYGSHRLEAQVELKSAQLPEKLASYFTTSDFDLWSVHPDYSYCDGPSNNTVATLLDMLQRIDDGKLNDIQWRPAESAKPPLFSPEKIICDKQLVQSLVYDAVATFAFSDSCGPLSLSAESNLFGMFGVRFSFVATRSGLTRVKHYNAEDQLIKREAMAFARRHARAIDETYYARTVDYNMLINETAALVQVPFNAHLKIAELLAKFELDQVTGYGMAAGAGGGVGGAAAGADVALDGLPPLDQAEQDQPAPASSLQAPVRLRDMNLFEKLDVLANSSLHVVATQSIIVNEGAQRAVAGVTGVFYDYASFVLRFLNATNALLEADDDSPGAARQAHRKPANCYLASGALDESCATGDSSRLRCGFANDTVDCLLVDNNAYIVASEQLEFIGRHLRAYDAGILARLVSLGVLHELNITDYQSICVKQGDNAASKQAGGASSSACRPRSRWAPDSSLGRAIAANLVGALLQLAGVAATISGFLVDLASSYQQQQLQPQSQQQLSFQAMSALLPNKTYLRPCDRVLTRHETRAGPINSDTPQYLTSSRACNCPAWFVYEQVPKTNLLLLIVETAPACGARCASGNGASSAPESSGALASAASPAPSQPADDDSLMTQYNIIGASEEQVCSMFERESTLFRKKLDSCISHHPDEEEIKLCGRASHLDGPRLTLALALAVSTALLILFGRQTGAVRYLGE